VRRLLHAFASNEAAFVFAAFVVYGVLSMGPLALYKDVVVQLERYLIVPWGMALCLVRLERQGKGQRQAFRWDLCVLFVLLLWIIVPFALRFGMTGDNVFSWHSWAVIFFGVYALTSEGSAEHRERLLDVSSALFAVFSFVLGALLLYCAATGKAFGKPYSQYGFGVHNRAQLCMGMHHNSSGIIALCCALMSAIGFFRRRNWLARLAHLVPSMLMGIVVVLTQSRTSRYCLLASLALGCWGAVAGGGKIRRPAMRHAAGLLLAAIVLAVGYAASSAMTDAALDHYAQLHAQAKQEAAIAAGKEQAENMTVKSKTARGSGDMSFTGRTTIWKNVAKLWKENPKYLVIGHGVGRIAKRIMEGTIVERDGAVYSTTHNTYLQFIADFGLIGFLLMAAFLAMQILPCMRVFFAAGQTPGYRVLCGVVVGGLLTGMMESVTLTAMNPINIMTFFALALIAGRDRDMRSLV